MIAGRKGEIMTPTLFAAFAFGPSESFEDTPATHRVDAVIGAAQPEPGWLLVRTESEQPVESSLPLVYFGQTRPVQYTPADGPASPDHAIGPFASGAKAVIIPIRKSEAWWALPEADRRAHFAESAGHTHVGLPYIGHIHRRLYHSRGVGQGYDFVTYFEFAPEDADYFRQLLAGLRDRNRNPEWRYVEAEWEIWMTKL